jgi:hypothetical protein
VSRNRSRWSGNLFWLVLLALILWALIMGWIPLPDGWRK